MSLPDCCQREPERCILALDTVREPSSAAPERLHDEVPCWVARLKHRIIRLRRRTHDDWPQFREEVTEHLPFLLAHFNTRWLVSICDTFADHGTPIERRNAMFVSLLVAWEKLVQTRRLADASPEWIASGAPSFMREPQLLWDGVTSMVTTPRADMLRNLFSRLGVMLGPTPHLLQMMETVVERMRACRSSTIAALDRVHERDLFADVSGALATAGALPAAEPVAEPGPDRAVHDALRGLVRSSARYVEISESRAGRLEERVESLGGAMLALAHGLEGFLGGTFAQHRFEADLRHRDVIDLLSRIERFAPPLHVELRTEHPVAEASVDHRFPHGTAKDNTRAPWFVARCEQILGPSLDVLDLGCAGGGLVFDFTLRGHRAVGLEGSDYSKQRLRAEWRHLHDRLFTCDVTRPFELIDSDSGRRMAFDLITAWDVMEHFSPAHLHQVFENVRAHLGPSGLFVGSVSTRPALAAPDGTNYHGTVRPKTWWVEAFRDHGFEWREDGSFGHASFARGNASTPLYRTDFASEPANGFHFVVAPALALTAGLEAAPRMTARATR
jgi:SAM-dependent methyltransferase